MLLDSILDTNMLIQFQQVIDHPILQTSLELNSTAKCNIKKIENYIKYNFLTITGVIQTKLQVESDTHDTITIQDLPVEMLGNIFEYCKITYV